MTKNKQLWYGLGAVALLVALIVISQLGGSLGGLTPPPLQPVGQNPQGTPPNPSKPGTPPGSSGPVLMVSPKTGDQWVIGQPHIISWVRAAGKTGVITLLDGQTKKTVGWILANTDSNQTSYTWDARAVSLGRSNPSKIDVQPGTYVIKVTFDGPGAPAPLQSAQFSIISPSQVVIPSYTVTIKGGSPTPKAVTLKKGDKITFVNSDAVSYSIKLNVTFPPIPLSAYGTYVLDTATLSLGHYQFYSEQYPGLVGSFVVQ